MISGQAIIIKSNMLRSRGATRAFSWAAVDGAESYTLEVCRDSRCGALLERVLPDLDAEYYGEFALAPARLLNRSSMPNVIAPAWKPYGHRQTL